MVTATEARAGLDSFVTALQANAARRTTGIPLYLQAANAIEQALREQNPPSEQPLPSERDLSNALHVSRPTLRQALAYLTDSGWIYTRRGVGTFPAPRVLERPLGLSSLYDDLKDSGLEPATRVLRLSTTSAAESVARELHIAVGTPLLSMERLRLAGSRPVALIETLIDLKGNPTLTEDDLEGDGLYNLLRARYGIEVVMGAQWVSARLATRHETQLLQLRSPAAVLVRRRVTFDAAGRGLEVSNVVFPEGTRFVEGGWMPG